jgi:biotin synthase
MNEQLQALCFFAGANSIFYGDRLLTTSNPLASSDQALFARLGLVPEGSQPSALPHQSATRQFHDAMTAS